MLRDHRQLSVNPPLMKWGLGSMLFPLSCTLTGDRMLLQGQHCPQTSLSTTSFELL